MMSEYLTQNGLLCLDNNKIMSLYYITMLRILIYINRYITTIVSVYLDPKAPAVFYIAINSSNSYKEHS